MKHTLVAAFATLTDANRTRGDLMARGIPREQIHAVGAESADIHAYDAPYSTSPDVPVDRHEHESKVAHFFKSLFGHEPHEQHRHYATAYPDAVRRGALVIAVDVVDEDQLARARDALEYNGAIDIDEHGGSGTADGYPGPSSPYVGATGGDSHLDKHFIRPTSGTTGATTGAGRYDIGSAAKRAGTDYPETTATSHPTGAGITGHGSNSDAPEIAPGVGTREAGLCRDRICVIQRPS